MASRPDPSVPASSGALSDPGWRRRRLREGLWVWAVAFLALVLARYVVGPVVPWIAANLKAVAVLAFLYLPGWLLWRRGETLSDYGLTLAGWRRDLKLAFLALAVIFPPFVLGFWAFVALIPAMPDPLAVLLAPYPDTFDPALRIPPDLAYLLVVHLLVVAVPEEFFYRGFVYARLAEGLDEGRRGRRFLGVVVGPAFLLTALLFAVGHLTEPYFWRLGVFFPALVFGWLRLRTGRLLAPVVFHGLSNVFIAVLEASFFPP